MGKKEKHVRRKEGSQMLKCDLTEVELLRCGESLADAQTRLCQLESEKKQFNDEIKGRVANAEGDIQRYTSLITSRYEHRQVITERVLDYDEGTVTVIRKDSDEIVESRKMTEEEMQMGLEFDEEPDSASPADDINENRDPGEKSEMDELCDEAMKLIHEKKRATTSMIQRSMKIGYTKAARIMDELEQRGLIGPPRGSDPREILDVAPENEEKEEE